LQCPICSATKSGLYSHRTAGRDRHYRNPRGITAAGHLSGTRSGISHKLQEQSDAAGYRVKNSETGSQIGWLVQLLPLLEQQALAATFNPNGSVFDDANAGVRSATIPTLHCASDPKIRRPGAAIAAFSSYAGCYSGSEIPIDSDNDGCLFLHSDIGHREIQDGASNTILVGEKRRVDEAGEYGWVAGNRSTLRNTGTGINAGWDLTAEPGRGQTASPVVIPSDTANGGFSSAHTGGAQFLLADGSVRFLSENIDMTVFPLLGNRGDLQYVGEF